MTELQTFLGISVAIQHCQKDEETRKTREAALWKMKDEIQSYLNGPLIVQL